MQIKNESLVKSLQKTGFTDKEALVYVSLLELGGAYPSKIAEYCGLKRATTYNVLTTLSVRGLVNEIEKRNKIFYQIEKPHKLITYSNSRVEIAKEGLERAEKIMPDLESLFSMLGDKPKVLFFEGPETVQEICNDIISSKGNFEMTGFSNADKFKNMMSKNQLIDFIKAKDRLNITTRGVLPDTPANRSYSKDVFQGVRESILPQIRYLSADKFIYDAEITIYGNKKVAMTKFGNENIIGVIIEDKIIHDMMKMIFELAWNSPEVHPHT
jgi:HTH-type transcriptional regulator, sugar sensing transcriptional regulator